MNDILEKRDVAVAPTVSEEQVAQLELLFEEDLKPKRRRVIVVAHLPHLEKYKHDPTRELVYGCDFAVSVGDQVICPPTPLRPSTFTAMVISLDASEHPYKGPVKNLIGKVEA